MASNRKNLGRKPSPKPKQPIYDARAEAVQEIENLLFTWIEERLQIVPATRFTSNGVLYASYTSWMGEQLPDAQVYLLDPLRWGIRLRAMGHPAKKYGAEKVRWGMVIK